MNELRRKIFWILLFVFFTSYNTYSQSDEVLSDWETTTPVWQGNTYTSTLNPFTTGINTSNNCGLITTTTNRYDIIYFDMSEAADFTVNPIYKIKVYAPASGGNVLFKLENSGNTLNVSQQVTPTPGAWQELSFYFSG